MKKLKKNQSEFTQDFQEPPNCFI